MNNSKIEWTDKTWNPVTGCTKVSAGCKNCYAEATFKRFEKKWGDFSQIEFHPNRLNQIHKLKPGTKVFVNSMSDLFHEHLSLLNIYEIMITIERNPSIIFQILTKRPQRAKLFCDVSNEQLPNNVWLGVSVENQKTADERIPILLDIPSNVRFLSCEPLLGKVDLTQINGISKDHNVTHNVLTGVPFDWDYAEPFEEDRLSNKIDWVIVGGESGRNARPMHPDWVRSIRDQCQEADVPFFFKQWGEWAPRAGELTGGGTNFQELDPSCKKWPNVIRLGENGKDTRFLENCDTSGESIFMQKVGKKNAGSLLDGREWKEFPR